MTNNQLANKLNNVANSIVLLPVKVVSKVLSLVGSSGNLGFQAIGAMISLVVTSPITVPMFLISEKLKKL